MKNKKFTDTIRCASLKIVICGENQYRDLQGIHLRSPDQWYLDDAIQTAERDNFSHIYMHYEHNGSRYRVPSDVLKSLFEYAQDFQSLKVSVIDPRGEK
jgi:hypothetical protein